MADKNIEALKEKLNLKKKKLIVEKENKELEQELTHTTYDVFQDKSKKGRHFLITKVLYNPETKKAVVSEVREFEDKTVGIAMSADKSNREYLFNKAKGVK